MKDIHVQQNLHLIKSINIIQIIHLQKKIIKRNKHPVLICLEINFKIKNNYLFCFTLKK